MEVEFQSGKHVDLESSIKYSDILGELVKKDKFQPDLVIGIREGGILPAKVIANCLNCDIKIISVRRKLSALKHNKFMRLLASTLGEFLARFYTMRRMMRLLNQVPGRSIDSGGMEAMIGKGAKILIVDDFSCSGETFEKTEEYLESQGAEQNNIKTAAIIAVPNDESGNLYIPDYFLASDVWVYFPWSSNSPYYSTYLKWKEPIKGI